ncbi:MAG: glutathione S-transferase N-terminal domain-containing protein [Proteobacteria bacterium]|nr:glutathione S-transferase N-terminal domain-containing protein [Pseudomonadota bacterium]
MKLRFAPTSPYVRKCRVAAHELGLTGAIEIAPTNPWEADTTIAAANPLGKIPALETAAGLSLFDSRVICEYLDALVPDPVLFPSGANRWPVLRLAAIGEGILDAADARIMESRRAPEQFDAAWDGRKQTAIARALDELERLAPGFTGIDIGLITAGCALGELDFRFPLEDWRGSRAELARWYETFAQRPSMAATVTVHWEVWQNAKK